MYKDRKKFVRTSLMTGWFALRCFCNFYINFTSPTHFERGTQNATMTTAAFVGPRRGQPFNLQHDFLAHSGTGDRVGTLLNMVWQEERQRNTPKLKF